MTVRVRQPAEMHHVARDRNPGADSGRDGVSSGRGGGPGRADDRPAGRGSGRAARVAGRRGAAAAASGRRGLVLAVRCRRRRRQRHAPGGGTGRCSPSGCWTVPTLLRLAIAPELARDEELARRLLADLTEPGPACSRRGRRASRCRRVPSSTTCSATSAGTSTSPGRRCAATLRRRCEEPGVRIEVVRPERAQVRAAVHRASFEGSTFTDERWHAMAGGLPYADARCLVAYDDRGQRGSGSDGVVGRPGQARVARADGRAPRPPRSRLRPGHHRCRGGRPAGAGLVERDGLHPELQRRRRRHLPLGRLPAAATAEGPIPRRLSSSRLRLP